MEKDLRITKYRKTYHNSNRVSFTGAHVLVAGGEVIYCNCEDCRKANRDSARAHVLRDMGVISELPERAHIQ